MAFDQLAYAKEWKRKNRRKKSELRKRNRDAIRIRWLFRYDLKMLFDPIEFPIFQMELADIILRKVRHRIH